MERFITNWQPGWSNLDPNIIKTRRRRTKISTEWTLNVNNVVMKMALGITRLNALIARYV